MPKSSKPERDNQPRALQISNHPPTMLIPYANNARLHSRAQINKIVKSIKRFGWVNPIIIDSENNVLCGHGRLEAVLKMGLSSVPTIILDHAFSVPLRNALLQQDFSVFLAFVFNEIGGDGVFQNNWHIDAIKHQLDRTVTLVIQRLHEADLAGELIMRGWHELRLAAIAIDDERVPIGLERFYQRREGCALHPARDSINVLKRIRAEDSRVFEAQYQQTPVPIMGNCVNPSWFGNYAEPPAQGIVVQSWDTASKTGVKNDFSVGITAIYYMKRYYILDVFREKLEFGALRAKVTELCRSHKMQQAANNSSRYFARIRHPLSRDPSAASPRGTNSRAFKPKPLKLKRAMSGR